MEEWERHWVRGRVVMASKRLSAAAYGSGRWVRGCAVNRVAAKRMQMAGLGDGIALL
jgi:hypothetical protein